LVLGKTGVEEYRRTYDMAADSPRGFTFMRSIRQRTEEKQQNPGVGEYALETKKTQGPKFSVPKEDKKFQSYYA
jgi:hypothetical protein